MEKTERILVAPLDWGLGHATRCIPLIQDFLANGNEVILGTYGLSGQLLKKEFPELRHIELPGISINYPSGKNMVFKMLLQLPKIIRSTSREHLLLQRLIDEEGITKVVSDNRYGLYSKKIPCVFITHQLFIRAGIWTKLVNRINHSYIREFTECWIPDYEGENNLSGELSHGKHQLTNTRYIGPLSRFINVIPNDTVEKFDYLLLISGPEPQRSIFEKSLAERFRSTEKSIMVIRGSEKAREIQWPSHAIVKDLATQEELGAFMAGAKHIICRSGYSTIMDLHALNKKAEFIPTPGQTEQIYLAEIARRKGSFFSDI